ncbi:putative two-component system sensor kinase [Actinacidiphila reveromycinica]|uniref:histidine kinase n=1 Tax=Actinacidiphila reveromycinica TaxID=659352 RepID=A0A7U3VQD5_9ACTN|nr:HAMP domain-containing sensor histidine kinase [Streptomyces sp. SN-593]BBA99665.1 putative two-component system sensor kinase [Streptomyces sp. SN-593]
MRAAATAWARCGFWPRPHSLRGRFTIANVLFLAVGLVLAAAASIAATYMVLIGEIDDSLKSSQSAIEHASVDARGLRQLCTLADLLGGRGGSALAKTFQQELLIVLDPHGRPGAMCQNGVTPVDAEQRALAAALPDLRRLAGGRAATVHSGGRSYRVVGVRLADGTLVVRGMRLSGVDRAVGKLLIVEGCVGVVLLALLAAGSLTAARRRLSPLEAMVETASAISEGDLSRRVPEPTARHGSEEVEQLSGSLNAMLQQIETAVTESERATAQLRQFLADASHELRTPLASVRGYLQLYEKGMLDADEKDRALRRVSAEALRMSRLVDELLALARLDDRPALRLGPVDLACLVREAAADLAAQQPERPVTVLAPDAWASGGAEPAAGPAAEPPGAGRAAGGLAAPAGRDTAEGHTAGLDTATLAPPLPDAPGAALPPVLGDEAGLRQIVGNLLDNVRVHTPAAAPVTVEVAAHGDGEVRLSVTDHGPGLAPDDARRVFDRFFRAAPDRARDTGGAGLGMSIVQALVQAHHGRVSVETAPGRGLTVRVTLPAASRHLASA